MELKKRGFSLIELTVVIGLLSLLILAISSTMLMSVISSNRIKTVTKVKQAGNYAIGQIQTIIRNAKAIMTCDSTNATISIVNPDGAATTLSSLFVNPNTRIASNSGVYLTPDNLNVSSFSLTCYPDDINPSLVQVSFDLKDTITSNRASDNPLLHFETSINLRNE